MIAAWATTEASINQANSYAWHHSKKTVSAVVPINLQRKIALFEKIHRDLLPFEPLRQEAAEIVTILKAQYGTRHWMAHGYVLGPHDTDGVWKVVKDEFHKDGSISTLTRTFTRDEFTTIIRELTDLSKKFTAYIYVLIAQIEQQPLHN